MTSARILSGFLILVFISLSRVKATCVWNSDFGFTLDCAFKKSSLFRVRNLGGIKTHVGLGFTVGDDLLFPDSLGNSDSKRRSVSNRDSLVAAANGVSKSQDQSKGSSPPKQKNRLTVRIPSSSTVSPTQATTINVVASPVEDNSIKTGRSSASSVRQLSLTNVPAQAIPPFKPIPPAEPPKQGNQNVILAKIAQANQNIASTQRNPSRMGQVPKGNFVNISPSPMRVMSHGQNTMTVGQSIGVINNIEPIKTISAPPLNTAFPQFQAMPASTTKVLNNSPKPLGSVSIVSPQSYSTGQIQKQSTSYNPNLVALRKVHEVQSNSFKPMQKQGQAQFSYSQIANYVTKPAYQVDSGLSQNIITSPGSNTYTSLLPEGTLYDKILAISRATNISVEAIEAAIKLRQQQLISQMLNSPPSTTSTTTTTTTTTPRPRPPPPRPPPPPPPPKRHTKPQEPAQKVMNAPKEYYPVGYEKNFDDNFETKVDLPETTFYCGDQKHFPGLYGDEDLGCMVFHVCALTDDGLIMKSFLCPESTLFDQTILKCNWWFYVDCKNTRKLYDSNIPISKSYQLMKALTFFSSYKKETLGNDQKGAGTKIEENREGVNNAIKILQKESHMSLPKVQVVEAQSNRTVFSITRDGTPVNVVEVNSLSTPVDESENNGAEKTDRTEKQVKTYRYNANRSSSEERKNRLVPKTIISPTSSSFQARQVSTQKSVKISTSQERKSFSRRPSISKEVSKENVTKSSEVITVSKERQSLSKASAEKLSKEESKVELKAVFPTVVSIQEVTSNSKVQTVTPSRQSVHDAIAKLDEAVMGNKKPT